MTKTTFVEWVSKLITDDKMETILDIVSIVLDDKELLEMLSCETGLEDNDLLSLYNTVEACLALGKNRQMAEQHIIGTGYEKISHEFVSVLCPYCKHDVYNERKYPPIGMFHVCHKCGHVCTTHKSRYVRESENELNHILRRYLPFRRHIPDLEAVVTGGGTMQDYLYDTIWERLKQQVATQEHYEAILDASPERIAIDITWERNGATLRMYDKEAETKTEAHQDDGACGCLGGDAP